VTVQTSALRRGRRPNQRPRPFESLELERLRRAYVATKHPVFLWQAYRVYRDVVALMPTLEAPAWVFDELDGISARVLDLCGTIFEDPLARPARWMDRVAGVFGFQAGHLRYSEAECLALKVAVLVADGHKPHFAQRSVAKEHPAGVETVRAAWVTFRDSLALVDLPNLREELRVLEVMRSCRAESLKTYRGVAVKNRRTRK
jgi:hypothetical protein